MKKDERLSRSKVSSLAPVVADLRSRVDVARQIIETERSLFMLKIKTEGLIRYRQIKV